ncbi:MAG TPA: tetratricopeptide repeat protein [bacterium]|mgnify:CR=1 FL=1|nr:tetratricopeptide repeat protein [bacterium]HOL46844.1 tetratricopeptide repeat protein [bacterium]HPQ18807.1 tetratricopeptide repeat protein [bacterium]
MADDFSDISSLLQQTAEEARKKKEETLTKKSENVEDIFSEWDFTKEGEAISEEEDIVPFDTALDAFKKKKKEIPLRTKLIIIALVSGVIGMLIYYFYVMPFIYNLFLEKVENYIKKDDIASAEKNFELASKFRFNFEAEIGDFIEILLKNNDTFYAKKYIDKLLSYNKNSEVGLDYLIKYYIATDKINAAEEAAQQYMNKHKFSYKLSFNKAEIAYKKGKIDEAIKLYTQTYLLKSDYLEPYLKLRRIYIDNKMYRKVIDMQTYIDALKQKPPMDFEAYFDVGRAYFYLAFTEEGISKQEKEGLLIKARDNFERCIRLKPRESELYLYIGSIYEYLSNYEYALRYYSEYLKLKPTDANAYANIGIIYFKNKNVKEAVKHLQAAIRIDDSLIKAHYYIAHLFLYEFDDYPNAINEYKKVLLSDEREKYDNLNFHLATAYLKNRDYDMAINYYTELYKNNQNDIDVIYNLGLAYLLNNKAKIAIDFFEKLKDKLSYKPEFFNNLAVAYEVLNNEKEALKNYWKTIEILEQSGQLNKYPFLANNFQRYINKKSYTQLENIVDMNLRLKPIR